MPMLDSNFPIVLELGTTREVEKISFYTVSLLFKSESFSDVLLLKRKRMSRLVGHLGPGSYLFRGENDTFSGVTRVFVLSRYERI